LLILLTQTDAARAALVATRIADRILECTKDMDVERHVTIGIGMATAPRDGLTLDDLVHAASLDLKSAILMRGFVPPSVH
jgi:GGDEF domain-containing protein